jgi:fimbrial chaperone protein
MGIRWLAILLAALGLSGIAAAQSTLRVSPVLLDVHAPTAAAAIRIWNDSDRPINVQIRLFRWGQAGGEDQLEPTADVAVSPPLTTLQPGSENVVRVVRTSKAPVAREESYRLIVDELPDPARRRPGTVALAMRYSIPVFFAPPGAPDPQVSWSVASRPDGLLVTAHNGGGSRLRIADLVLREGDRAVAQQGGLVGYVLAGSTASWLVPAQTRPAAGPLTLSATSESGQVRAVASLEGG